MPLPVITETDMTTPRSKVTLDYDTYSVELNYDNNLLTNAIMTPLVPDTDPDYLPTYRMNALPAIRRVMDAIYDYKSKV